jgi:UDP-N-acetylglucosamine 2-epimerase (non-hydrolysing)
MAPVIKEVEKYPDILEPVVVVTGQHRQMLDQVLPVFGLAPDYDLGIMQANQTLTSIVTKSLSGLEEIILRERPDMLLVQGDTSTVFAAALEAFYYRGPVGHVEAGLRTFDKWQPFPEEVNRKLTTTLADLHFAPTATAVRNLLEEKVPKDRIYLTGNTVIDALLAVAGRDFSLEKAGLKLDPDKKTVLVTLHRRESLGQPMRSVCSALRKLADKHRGGIEVVIPVHRNPQVGGIVNEFLGNVANVKLIEPLDYEAFVHVMKASYIILTDSGGVQEEAPSLGKPVLVMREKTERPDAVTAGVVKLVGTDEDLLFSEADRLLSDRAAYEAMSRSVNPYGDGCASGRIAGALLHYFGARDRRPEEFDVKTAG